MKKKHQLILKKIYARPVSATIAWKDIESLFIALGAEIEEREGSRVSVFLFNEIHFFHRPHPQPTTDKGAIASIRKWLEKKWSKTMKNILEFEKSYKAIISYDSDIEMFRGEFIGINGSADFYAKDIENLKKEGSLSLKVFLEACKEKNIEPKKKDGKFALRLDPELYQLVFAKAKANNVSINTYIQNCLKDSIYA